MKLKICGIIIAKENSKRFPGKNYFEYKGKPLFMHNVDLLKKCYFIDDIYVATDSPYIIQYISSYNINPKNKKEIKIIKRKINAVYDEQPFLDIVKFVYLSLSKKYDLIVSILANSMKHKLSSLETGHEIFLKESNNNVNEARSFDDEGNQSGIFFFREKLLLNFQSSIHQMVSILDNGKEIHFKDEIYE